MKIACLVENLGTFGGTQKQFLRIAENLVLQGHKVEIFTAKFKEEYALGVDKVLKINVVEGPEKYNAEYAKEFLRHIRPQLAEFDWLLVGDGLIYLKYYFPEAKVCWICNDAPYSHKAFVYGHGLKFRVKHFLKLFLFSLSNHQKIKIIDKIIVLDSKMQKTVKSHYNRYAKIIRSGIDMVEAEIMAKAPDKILQKYEIERGQYILALGIAYPYRNFEVLIKGSAFTNPSLKILIIAPDHYDKVYYRKILALATKFKTVILNPEFISEEEKYILLQHAVVFVFPNKDQTWGLTPLEAASVKTPIIVSSQCGVTEVLEENKTALIFDPDDHNELSAKINLLYNDRALASRLKSNAYDLVSSELNWHNYTANIINYLKQKD